MLSGINLNNGWIGASPIETLVSRACEPSLGEPPYQLHIELAEYINKKKANTPREAAQAIVRTVNHRNPHVSLLALALLHSLVQSCGYPFHLQIATKEFLNELVRRFPERPPPFPGPVMSRILELINEWKEGICSDSRWKEDLGNIRDMWRLLSYKGYRFKDAARTADSTTQRASNIKSAEELENEDREAQEAKLQELIRRGTPRDLAAAQELMKTLAGANPDAKPDYKTQALTELNKLESKVILLNEMLDNVDTSRGERFARGDVYDQVASILSNARPKIQKWISDAETQSDDSESLDAFLQINDQINTVLNRYDSFKKGDYVAAANPIPSELATNQAKSNLIDLDLDPQPTAAGSGTVTDDLMGLFGGPDLSSSSTPAAQPPKQTISAAALSSLYNNTPSNQRTMASPPLGQSSHMASPSLSTSNFGSIALPSTPGGSYNGTPGRGGGTPLSWSGGSTAPAQPQLFGGVLTPSIDLGGNQSTTSQQPPQHPAGKDPFADLAGLF
ncbi:VHS-domain-containing protein [Sistotremastrum niveocremeum HHB9708]|uniref:VHS-domain-containing protein n=1 Tax=Sistotremastrum niveocremeum HHB9708 TaxID=1314777 RepID=A0A164PYZ8_9AGAM|nr:VHS-domain-containing protein [Sistotremastrum niveocremeum HHB9708]